MITVDFCTVYAQFDLEIYLDLRRSLKCVKQVGEIRKHNKDYPNQSRGYRDISICGFHPLNMLNNRGYMTKEALHGNRPRSETYDHWVYKPQSILQEDKVGKRYTILHLNGPIPGTIYIDLPTQNVFFYALFIDIGPNNKNKNWAYTTSIGPR